MLPRVAIPQEQIAEFCHRWNIRELALFGSVLRNDFGDDSDVDILVKFKPETRVTIRDLMAMETELEAIFGREVDLGEHLMIENDPNYLRRRAILSSLQVIYEE
jgi:uncharacterized protein